METCRYRSRLMKHLVFILAFCVAACGTLDKAGRADALTLTPVSYQALDGWETDDLTAFFDAFTQSCSKIKFIAFIMSLVLDTIRSDCHRNQNNRTGGNLIINESIFSPGFSPDLCSITHRSVCHACV